MQKNEVIKDGLLWLELICNFSLLSGYQHRGNIQVFAAFMSKLLQLLNETAR